MSNNNRNDRNNERIDRNDRNDRNNRNDKNDRNHRNNDRRDDRRDDRNDRNNRNDKNDRNYRNNDRRDDRRDDRSRNTRVKKVIEFENLGINSHLLKGIQEKFNKPSKIQEIALPVMVGTQGKPLNLICQAKTGSGKTVAFIIGLLSHINTKVNETQGLIICHTRELAIQVHNELKLFGKYMIEDGLDIFLSIPSDDKKENIKSIKSHVIVGTPGKIKDHMRNRAINTKGIKVIVLDEADHALEKMADDIKKIKGEIMKASKPYIFLFSATFEPRVKNWAKEFVLKPYYAIFLEDINFDITHFKIDCTEQGVKRIDILYRIFRSVTSTKSIVFFNRIEDIAEISELLKKEGFDIFVIHSKLENKERDDNMTLFRKCTKGIMLTTNLLSRGIDVENVNLVINYDLPLRDIREIKHGDHISYIHRAGRTGRYGFLGMTINLLRSSQDFDFLNEIQKGVDQKINDKFRNRISKKKFQFRNYLKIENLELKSLESQIEEQETRIEENNEIRSKQLEEDLEISHKLKEEFDKEEEEKK